MIVISIQNAPPSLRGYLTKYMIQISAGVYVANVSARIRDAIWKRVTNVGVDNTKAVLVYTTDTEQGFDFRTFHDTWIPVDYDGLHLICIPFDSSVRFHSVAGSYVILDLETTGLDCRRDFILEIGALLVEDGVIVSEYNAVIRVPVPKKITMLTGITQVMADNGVSLEEGLMGLSAFIDGRDVIGYNIQQFDYKFLLESCKKCGMAVPVKRVIDVLPMIRKKKSGLSSYKLTDVAVELGFLLDEKAHRALVDCRLCKLVYDYCQKGYRV